MTEVRPASVPPEFARAVRSLAAAAERVRPEVRVEEMRPPQRLAPWSYALALEVVAGKELVASGRLVLLHDPAGHEAWAGTFRLVGYAHADLDPEMGRDPLLPEVGWSWLVDALTAAGAEHTAAGGTVTATTSTRFGSGAAEPASSEIELRASWTPVDIELGAHLRGWADVLCTAGGLPPPGVTAVAGPG